VKAFEAAYGAKFPKAAAKITDDAMFVGLGTIVLILVIVRVVLLMRRH
jgi:hypothetical protein